MDHLASSAGSNVKCSQMEDPPSIAPVEADPMSGIPGSNVNFSQLEDPPAEEAPTEPITIELHGDEFWPLSGKPFFHAIMTKTNLRKRYGHLALPPKMHPVLPALVIPTYLTFKGKEWKMVYHGCPKSEGKQSLPRFSHGWATFVKDSNLKLGDGCVFELTECTMRDSNSEFKFSGVRSHLDCQLKRMLRAKTLLWLLNRSLAMMSA